MRSILSKLTHSAKGFSLIELLVVISIIGLLSGLMITNLVGARARARDARLKGELDSVKKALALYQVQYGAYPGGTNGLAFNGCGPAGNAPCPYCSTSDFAAGGADGCGTSFMQHITRSGSYFFFRYYQCSGGLDYRLKASLENLSDQEIALSQQRCPAAGCASYGPTDYVVCP